MEEPDIIGTRGVFIMKKCYCVQLKNKSGDVAFHCRLKGIPSDVIIKKANTLYPNDIQCEYRDSLAFPIPSVSSNEEYSVWHLYKTLYDGETIAFDLCESDKPMFELKDFQVSTKTSFIRRIGLGESS